MQFSLSQESPKFFKNITVAANSSIRIFLFFTANAKGQIGERPSGSKSFEVNVSCRLVKDYQHIIKVQARCLDRQIFMHPTEVFFQAVLSERMLTEESQEGDSGSDKEISAPKSRGEFSSDMLYFERSFWDLPLGFLPQQPPTLVLANDTKYFRVDVLTHETNEALCPPSQVILRITPNLAVVEGNLANLKREKYVEERIAVYNFLQPKEHSRISLRMGFGILSDFAQISGGRSSHQFKTLEFRVITFLTRIRGKGVLFAASTNASAPPPSLGETPRVKVVSLDKDLFFLYQFLVDELIICCLDEHSGEAHSQLAYFLFRNLFDNQSFRSLEAFEAVAAVSKADQAPYITSPGMGPISSSSSSVISPPMAPLPASSHPHLPHMDRMLPTSIITTLGPLSSLPSPSPLTSSPHSKEDQLSHYIWTTALYKWV